MPATRRQLIVPPTLLAEIIVEAYRHFPLETGGVLLGRNDGPSTVVTVVIGPGPDATHRRFAFDPDQEWQEQAIADAWHAADHHLEYLGDWHTHPNGRPRPSKLDITALRTIRDSPDARAAHPVMLIVSVTDAGSIALRAKELGGRGRPRTLDVRTCTSNNL